jgi:murein L,D-transpeptidase YcbB/YkuD
MRVERAADLAAWVLEDEPAWSKELITAAMNGSETIQVNLKRPIPVLVVYGTAVALEGGEVRFFEDIYGYDAILEKYLTARSVQPRSTSFTSHAHQEIMQSTFP